MLFNSVAFAVFLPLAFAGYWLAGRFSHRLQNAILLVLSYVFYAWWDVRFLALIVLSSFTDYFVGLRMGTARSRGERKALMGVSLAMNLGVLAVFKYLGFFAGQFGELLQGLGFAVDDVTLSILLPVGVSFYTFQTLSYTIDVYREQLEPERDIVAFFAFVAFFPQLVAGPIERASRLLPQIAKARRFDVAHAREGLRMMLWGLIAKVVIADNLAPIVDDIFAAPAEQDSLRLLWGAVAFAFQIYGDFAGYSLIAIGVARLFGIELMWNFAYPYFSTSIADFWRRWHISLSSWFRDYVFIPLGGSRTTEPLWVRNILVTFTVSGLWHGANWTFLMWGFLHGCYYLPTIARSRRTRLATEAASRSSGTIGGPSGGGAVATKTSTAPARTGALHQLGLTLGTFAAVVLAWVFFRADSIGAAFEYLGELFTGDLVGSGYGEYKTEFALLVAFVALEWLQRQRHHALEALPLRTEFRWLTYAGLIFVLLTFGRFGGGEFIYFQF